ncbi:DegT/DnrJ/EryC1/StrS family aminotransferase [Candidatus Sumerlaeota bacterium]|nr:DegT/DnrJ/EryC1/StrS family aminotransferase [Candidatus Sumerlaeota bacterium]
MNWEVPLFNLTLDAAEQEAVLAVMKSGWLTQGERVADFERTFAERLGSRFAIAVSSCTAGLHLVAHALGLGQSDEVILPSLSFVAAANVTVETGATPVFADVESFNRPLLDPVDVERKITDRTRAIIALHYAGHPCDMTALCEVAQCHNLHIIEDCAHAPLAEWDGRKVGTFGIAGVFSFFSNKNLATGEGGMIVTDDPALAQRLALLRSHGMTHPTLDRHKGHAFGYDVIEAGFNYRMDEMRAAIGLVQLNKLESNNERRAQCAARYCELLADLEWAEVPFLRQKSKGKRQKSKVESQKSKVKSPKSKVQGQRSVYHIFPIILGDDAPSRDRLMKALRDDRIQTSIHYRPIHDFTFYRQRYPTPDARLPITSALAPGLLTLPLYPTLTAEQQEKVVTSLARHKG